jgi:hypothetical protein
MAMFFLDSEHFTTSVGEEPIGEQRRWTRAVNFTAGMCFGICSFLNCQPPVTGVVVDEDRRCLKPHRTSIEVLCKQDPATAHLLLSEELDARQVRDSGQLAVIEYL